MEVEVAVTLVILGLAGRSTALRQVFHLIVILLNGGHTVNNGDTCYIWHVDGRVRFSIC